MHNVALLIQDLDYLFKIYIPEKENDVFLYFKWFNLILVCSHFLSFRVILEAGNLWIWNNSIYESNQIMRVVWPRYYHHYLIRFLSCALPLSAGQRYVHGVGGRISQIDGSQRLDRAQFPTRVQYPGLGRRARQWQVSGLRHLTNL